jgi:hypothetical protein
MSFLRGILGGGTSSEGTGGGSRSPRSAVTGADPSAPDTGMSPADDEAARERELLRAEAERLSDDLIARQVRYADRSWTPPAQGGPRRADDRAAED